MVFKIGNIPWNKERKIGSLSEETRQKIRLGNLGLKRSKEIRQKMAQAKKGTKLSEKHKENISKSLKDHKGTIHTEETKKKMSLVKIGIHIHSEKHKQELSLRWRNKNNPRWKGGIINPNHYLRTTKKWKEWRKAIFERDNYECCCCLSKGYLHPHHILGIKDYPEQAFEIQNGLTLCYDCHIKSGIHKGGY